MALAASFSFAGEAPSAGAPHAPSAGVPTAIRSCLESSGVRISSMVSDRYGKSANGRSVLEIEVSFDDLSLFFAGVDSLRQKSLVSAGEIASIEASCSASSVSMDRGKLVIVSPEYLPRNGEYVAPPGIFREKCASRYEKLRQIVLSPDYPGVSIKSFYFLADNRIDITAQILIADNIFVFLESFASDQQIGEIDNFLVERRLKAGILQPYFTCRLTVVPR